MKSSRAQECVRHAFKNLLKLGHSGLREMTRSCGINSRLMMHLFCRKKYWNIYSLLPSAANREDSRTQIFVVIFATDELRDLPVKCIPFHEVRLSACNNLATTLLTVYINSQKMRQFYCVILNFETFILILVQKWSAKFICYCKEHI